MSGLVLADKSLWKIPSKRASSPLARSLSLLTPPSPYDLYINSSSLKDRERFVRIFKKTGLLTALEVRQFVVKYNRIYVAETERSLFLKSLCKVPEATAVEKATVLKDSAIHHLQTLFDHEVTTEVLGKAITECRDVVEGMIDVVGDCRVDQLQDLIGSLSFHDFYTYDHSINVSMYCILIYRAIKPNASREEIVQAGLGGLLHDLGKIKIPTDILNFSGKLSNEQFDEIKKHPGFGRELLQEVTSKLPADIQADLLGKVIFEHHENFDGTGYPSKLAGENIHLLSRITTIADFLDAITTKRSYHEPLSFQEALALMAGTEGKKIDPSLFRFFVEHTQRMHLEKGIMKDLAPDFDPCQPCSALPLIDRVAPDKGNSSPVKTLADLLPKPEPRSTIKFVDPLRAARSKTGVLKPTSLKKKAG